MRQQVHREQRTIGSLYSCFKTGKTNKLIYSDLLQPLVLGFYNL